MVESLEHSEPKQQLISTYNLVSAGYDKEPFTRLCAERLVQLARMRRGEKVLNVATGTGWAAIAAARIVGPSGRVVGVDIARDMLAQARQKIDSAHLTNVELLEADAEHPDFPDNSFDIVTCASAIFFLPDMLAALREWLRVTKTGGRVAFSTFGDTLFQPMRDMLMARLRNYGISPPSHWPNQRRLAEPEKCRDFLGEAGLENVAVYSEQLGYHVSTANEYWDDSVLWSGTAHGMLSQLSPDKLKKLRMEHSSEVRALATGQGIWMSVPGIFSLGEKPPK